MAIQIAVYVFVGVVMAGILRAAGTRLPWLAGASACVILVDLFSTGSIEISGIVLGLCVLGELAVLVVLKTKILRKPGGHKGISSAPIDPLVVVARGLGTGVASPFGRARLRQWLPSSDLEAHPW